MKLRISTPASVSSIESAQDVTDVQTLQRLDGDSDGPEIAEFIEDAAPEGVEVSGGQPTLRYDATNGLRLVAELTLSQEIDEAQMRTLLDRVTEQLRHDFSECLEFPLASDAELVVHMSDENALAELMNQEGKIIQSIGGKPKAESVQGPAELRLLAEVYAEPSNDEPRERYAAWLTQRGDPRGEFISLSLRRARGKVLKKEEKAAEKLLTKHRTEWLGPLAPTVEAKECLFERGFLQSVFLSGDIRREPDWKTLYQTPQASTVTALKCYWPTEHGLKFLTNPHLKSLERLTLREETLLALGTRQVAWKVPSLSLVYVTSVDRTLDLLLESPGFGSLSSLRLQLEKAPDNITGFQEELFRHPLFKRIRNFSLSCHWGPDARHHENIARWLATAHFGATQLARIGFDAGTQFWVQKPDQELELEVELGSVGDFWLMSKSLAPKQFRKIRVVGDVGIPMVYDNLMNTVTRLEPETYDVPPPPRR
ncbi:MAG: hypothetical protein ACKVPX_02270 [Myxococcaceae bacterium]